MTAHIAQRTAKQIQTLSHCSLRPPTTSTNTLHPCFISWLSRLPRDLHPISTISPSLISNSSTYSLPLGSIVHQPHGCYDLKLHTLHFWRTAACRVWATACSLIPPSQPLHHPQTHPLTAITKSIQPPQPRLVLEMGSVCSHWEGGTRGLHAGTGN